MQNPIQEVLLTPSPPADGKPGSDIVAQESEVTSRLESRVIGLSVLIGFSFAIAVVTLLAGSARVETGMDGWLSSVGLGLMIWAAATFVFVFGATMLISRYAEIWRPRPIRLRRRRRDRSA